MQWMPILAAVIAAGVNLSIAWGVYVRGRNAGESGRMDDDIEKLRDQFHEVYAKVTTLDRAIQAQAIATQQEYARMDAQIAANSKRIDDLIFHVARKLGGMP